MDKYDLTYISFGGGNQSTALSICSTLGLHNVPKADYAVFSDTMNEIADTYEHIEFMKKWLSERGLEVRVVSRGDLYKDMMESTRSFIPAFTDAPDGAAPLRRKCTDEYKGIPIEAEARAALGFKPRQRIAGKMLVRALIGMSLDELQRMKDSRTAWIHRRYPLIDARLDVRDCAKICMEHIGYVPTKSACRFCPWHNNHYWRWLKNDRPVEFKKACEVDRNIRDLTKAGVKKAAYLHRSLKPLEEIDFEALVNDPKQLTLDGFINECEGGCGV